MISLSRRAAFLLVAFALAAGLPLAAPVAASVVQALSLEELTRKADLIVVGVGGEAQARRNADGRLIVTDVSVNVQEVLKGSAKPGQAVVVTLLGKPALLFLYRRGAAGSDLRVVGMAQGVMQLQPSDQGTMMIIPGGGSSALVERDSNGGLEPAPAALLQPQPAATILDRIRALVSSKSAVH